MSGRESNRWGECVNCGETLKPEDECSTSDRCKFCLKWTELAHIAINRRFLAEKRIKEAEKEGNLKAVTYWSTKKEAYTEIHKKLIEALNIKRRKLWHETY